MDLPEYSTHSFVVRIWLEETAEEADAAKWRGHITHIPSNARQYIENVDDIAPFIVPYLEAMGIRANNYSRGGPMTSIFSFLRGRTEASAGEFSEATTAEAEPSSPLANFALEAIQPIQNIAHGVPSLDDVLASMREDLKIYLPPDGDSLPDPNVSIIKVEEKPTGLGNHIGDKILNGFSFALKGGRLQTTIRFQLWASTPNDVDLAIDELHGRLLAAKDDLWIAGFLRFVADGSNLAEHIPSLGAWRRTADYHALYEFRYTDTDGAQSLIARIPIHTDPETPDSPQRETAIITDEMARWDEESAPALDMRGRLTVSRFSAYIFVPGTLPAGSVRLLRTFEGATGTPGSFPDLGQFVSAVTNPTAPERHAGVTFATFGDFLAEFSPAGDAITLVHSDEDLTLDSYLPISLILPTPITLPEGADHLVLIYQPGSDDPKFDRTAVLYIRAGPL